MRPAEAAELLRRCLKESKIGGKEVLLAILAIQNDALEAAAWLAGRRSKSIAFDIRQMKSKTD